MATGGFDNHTHEQLQAMIANGAPTQLTMQGATLDSAGSVMRQISEYLVRMSGKVEWQGEAGNAFRAWSKEFAREADKLGTYSTKVGNVLSNAGQALSETKSGMPTAASDGVWREEAAATPGAGLAREKQRQEAIAQLERLDSHYKVATENLTKLQEPNFRPISDVSPIDASPGRPGESQFMPPGVAQRTGATTSVGAASAGPGTVDAAPPTAGATPSSPLPGDSASRTELDAAPPAVTEPRALTGASGNTSPSTAPPASGPSPVPAPAVGGTPPPAQGGRPSPITGGGVPSRAPNTPTGAAPPTATGGPGRPVVPPAGSGIHGGRPVPPTNVPPRPAGMPRGTVISADTPPLRPAPGAGTAPSPGASGPRGTGAAQPHAGRPGYTTHTPPQPGAPSKLSGKAFTPGGTGLVQGGTTSGSVAPTSASSRRTERRDGERPDYLKEDEQTWQRQVRRRVVPPVID